MFIILHFPPNRLTICEYNPKTFSHHSSSPICCEVAGKYVIRSRETKAFLLETAAKLLFCKETLGEGPVVEDNCGVRAGIEASHGAKGTNL